MNARSLNYDGELIRKSVCVCFCDVYPNACPSFARNQQHKVRQNR